MVQTLTNLKWISILLLLFTLNIQLLAQSPCNPKVAPPNCNMTPQCDGDGNITIEIFDKNTCSCITRPVEAPTCKKGEKYSEEMCMCVPNKCYKVCDTTPYCDGNGWLITKELNPETCECETKALPAPKCKDGEKYDEGSCQCVPKTCTLTCGDAEWCEDGKVFKKVLDPNKCACVTKEIKMTDCDEGFIYDPYTCKCVPQTCTKTCDDDIQCQYGRYYQDILDKDK